ncbi:amidase [Vineibacter terrae]|uniref:Amidase n=1 Tax=Vineibacter terrae TaxID=2586908 RepID=A0A5C8PQ55_9HYPH|nr:amidase [Vineibacter terrae]TXL77580.1 amidase [Vineibacter terrae]
MAAPLCPTVTGALQMGGTGTAMVLNACRARITEREGAVGAWEVVDVRAAMDSTPVAGPLTGLPVGVKDIIDTAAFATGYGSPIFAGHRPTADAACVATLKQAGALVLGKTVTTEFASAFPGKTRNPHNPAHTPGGSSSGSAAAVADGMVPVALGTQTAGSVIRPAAYCGVVGYKGSYGWTDMAGVRPLAPSLDTLGLFTRRVADIAPVRAVLAKGARAATAARMPARIRLFRTPMWDQATPEARRAVERALRMLGDAGASTDEAPVPASWTDIVATQLTIMLSDMGRQFAPLLAEHADKLSASIREQIEHGQKITPEAEQAARANADALRAEMATLLPAGEVWLTLAAPGEAPEGLAATGDPLFNRPWTLLGVPCVALPYRQGPKDLPLSVQLVAARDTDDDLLDAAAWIEDVLG